MAGFLSQLEELPVIGIRWGSTSDRIQPGARAVAVLGLRRGEVAFESENDSRQMSRLREAHSKLVIGVGVVREAEQVDAAIGEAAARLVASLP